VSGGGHLAHFTAEARRRDPAPVVPAITADDCRSGGNDREPANVTI